MTRHTRHLKLEVCVDLFHCEFIDVGVDLLHCEVIELCVDLLHCEVIEVCVDLLHCEVIKVCVDLLHYEVIEVCVDLLHFEVIAVCVDLLHCEVITLRGIIWSSLHPLEESRPRNLVLCAREEMQILLSHLIFSFPGSSIKCSLSSSLISSIGMTRFSLDRHFFRFDTWKFVDDRQYSCPVEFRKLSKVTARS
ncbi:hypothetical protein Tco_1055054 [Tanacetum coccineum]|uniref:Uncharacterized protein n=1 Tax=Tanacetum coccineum TaxID=301880 RepID=A0ABQ5H0E3_9ASTR